ncbi:MAG: 50S ribosomal protein L30 [Holosporales bacterium]|nr:50S ribosomal protein L30 [Holosporales bacterium]
MEGKTERRAAVYSNVHEDSSTGLTRQEADCGGSIRVRQIGSPIRRCKKQSLHLKSLGLRGIGSERELIATNSILGLVAKVRHLVKIV